MNADDHYISANRRLWDELVGVHTRAPATYDIDRLRQGGSSLKSIELTELGDVAGKSLLHLQCHFGMDALSWARLGAKVVGIDFSPRAIEAATSLGKELGIDARFECSDVYELPERLSEKFDIVFTSYGVLCWLPDLRRWGEVVARFLKPGGTFYIVEEHPLGLVFSIKDGDLVATNSYFNEGAVEESSQGSYADRSAKLINSTSFQWQHSLSEIVDSLADAGLKIEFLHEFPFCMFQALPSMVRGEDGWWRVPGKENLPFLFSLKAQR